MRIKSINLENFLSFEKSGLEFIENGVMKNLQYLLSMVLIMTMTMMMVVTGLVNQRL